MNSDSISGYDLELLSEAVLRQLPSFTKSSIEERLHRFALSIRDLSTPTAFSLGENCAAGMRLKEIAHPYRTSSLFDNIVANLESVIALLNADFADFLCLSNLQVDNWEGHDSVFDIKYKVFFHHYFYIRHAEKSDFSKGYRRRKIDETDIPLFLAPVRAQFEYLISKLRYLLRADVPKKAIFRRIAGEPLTLEEVARLQSALEGFGARQVGISIVHSQPYISGENYDQSIHHLICERGERWGSIDAWRVLA